MVVVEAPSDIHAPYHPTRRIAVLTIEVDATSDYALEPVKLFSSRKVRMLSCVVNAHPHERTVTATLFLDLSESTSSPEDIARELKGMPHMRRVNILELPLTLGSASLVTFTLQDVRDLMESAYTRMGDAGKVFAFHLGFGAGMRRAEEFMKAVGGRRALEYVLLWAQSLGWGRIELVNYAPKAQCVVRVRGLFECLGVKGVKEPRSHLFRGFLAGFLSKVWGRRVTVAETRCIALGDPYCEFMAVASG